MRAEAVLPLVATVIAWEFALALFRRWRASRRPYLRSWAISLFFFAAGSAFLWYGEAFGWSGPVFRGFYACGALLSVPWLAQGELELLARPTVTRIVVAFLVLFSLDGAITIAAAPFVDGAHVSGYAVPAGKDLFGALPRILVVASNAVGTLVVVGGTLWSGWRSRGRGPAARARFRGTLVITLGVLIAAAGGALTFLSQVASQSVTLTVGVAVMYAGFVLASRRPGSHRAERSERRRREQAETFAPGETPA
ncbi:MAG TPA: hypothetical protein VFQ85_06135 [Mycobacteriales bacterium]|jgi:hypothetical protein|nr:hypothetical protein [Mycobacteriales bacterium]